MFEHQAQQQAAGGADRHPAPNPQPQQGDHIGPARQLAQGQLQQQQGQHGADRLEDQALSLENLAQAWEQAHLLDHRCYHRGTRGQGDGRKHPGQGPGQPGQLVGQQGAAQQAQHCAHHHQLHDGALQIPAGQAQV